MRTQGHTDTAKQQPGTIALNDLYTVIDDMRRTELNRQRQWTEQGWEDTGDWRESNGVLDALATITRRFNK